MKVITKYRLADLIGTVYETTLKGRIVYEYRIRFHKQIVGRSYAYINTKKLCIDQMCDEMEMLFDSQRLDINQSETHIEITRI